MASRKSAWMGISAAFLAASLHAGYVEEVLKDEPVAYWRLGELELDEPIEDATGNDIDGEYFTNGSEGLALGFPGAIEGDDDTAARFQTTFGFGCGDCGQGRIPVGDVLDLGVLGDEPPMTLEAWFKLLPNSNTALPPSSFPRIFHYNNLEFGQYAFGVVGNDNAGLPGQRTVWAAIGDGSGSGGVIKAAATDAILPSDEEEWHHLVATIDGFIIRIFLDGEELVDLTDADPVAWQQQQATIGGRVNLDGALVQGFPGLIDELAVYGDVLADERIVAHYEAGIGAVGPTRFRRGDANGDGNTDISDGVTILGYLFLGTTAPSCVKSADTDDGGSVEITDAVYLLNHLFLGGAAPPAPFPECGTDPTPDDLSCGASASCA